MKDKPPVRFVMTTVIGGVVFLVPFLIRYRNLIPVKFSSGSSQNSNLWCTANRVNVLAVPLNS